MIIALVTVGAVSQFGSFPFPSFAAASPSIAVLPFQNLSGDSTNDFFSAGIHEDVMTQLYKMGGMTVISRTSMMQYRGTDKPLRTIARELGVATLLEASVRRIDNRVRIDARLIDAATDQQIWAESYDRELRDVLGIQAEIAHQIAGALHARLSPAAVSQLAATKQRTVDPARCTSCTSEAFTSPARADREQESMRSAKRSVSTRTMPPRTLELLAVTIRWASLANSLPLMHLDRCAMQRAKQ
jgi:TolB-like protein